ncbi:queuosine precursor transporter [Piscirickettsia salmonis]|uniref:queuosine precursor transporter n=1 Tax=Piscirickettsia salmonis TaxID=1238 RepID=UPI0009D6E4E4|nr:queuosine precursor transporter [Piscirickettsia salmonis]QGP38459.1 hypothetical protein Psal182_00581 [Piscirickettsia salmonis]
MNIISSLFRFSDTSDSIFSKNRKDTYKYSGLLLTIYISTVIITQVLAVRITSLAGVILPGGIFIFPLTFVINAVAGEVYGYSEPKKFIWLGFLSEIMFAGVTYAVTHMSYPSYFKESQAYNIVLDPAFRYAFSSLIGIFVGEFINIYILSKMKILMQGKNFLLRFLISNAIGQLFLSFIVDILIFFGKITVAQSLRAMEC